MQYSLRHPSDWNFCEEITSYYTNRKIFFLLSELLYIFFAFSNSNGSNTIPLDKISQNRSPFISMLKMIVQNDSLSEWNKYSCNIHCIFHLQYNYHLYFEYFVLCMRVVFLDFCSNPLLDFYVRSCMDPWSMYGTSTLNSFSERATEFLWSFGGWINWFPSLIVSADDGLVCLELFQHLLIIVAQNCSRCFCWVEETLS